MGYAEAKLPKDFFSSLLPSFLQNLHLVDLFSSQHTKYIAILDVRTYCCIIKTDIRARSNSKLRS